MAFRMLPMKFGDTPAEIENRRKTLLIYTFATLGSVFLMTFALASLLSGRLELGVSWCSPARRYCRWPT